MSNLSVPRFAKRHYEAIALAMQSATDDILAKEPFHSTTDLRDGVNYAIDHLCEAFRRDNPRFEPGRFKRACEPGANVRARS